MSDRLNFTTAVVTSVLRAGMGRAVVPLGARPQRPLVVYEFESCPFCRKVREALSLLDLEAEIRPCPKGGERYRSKLMEIGGKAQFPYLVDPNTGKQLYESDDIVDYLFAQYGSGPPPFGLRRGAVSTLGTVLAGLPRGTTGTFARPSSLPGQPLELYSYEPSPFCRVVRDRLCELELPYVLHNVARGSQGRSAFVKRSGKMQVPYLVDPNTGVEMFESADIIEYLEATYASA